jgi:hypothetical protein
METACSRTGKDCPQSGAKAALSTRRERRETLEMKVEGSEVDGDVIRSLMFTPPMCTVPIVATGLC